MGIFRIQQRIIIFIFGGCVSLMMYWLIGHGIGINADSIVYMDTAKSLLAGKGFFIGNEPMTHFPPLYPLLLAGAGLLYNGNFIQAGRLLSAIFMGANIVLVGIAVQRCSGKSLAAVGSMMLFFLSSVMLLNIHAWALTEPPFITFTLAALVLLSFYVIHSKYYLLITASISIALAIITRYIGVILLPVMALTIIILGNKSLKNRFKDILMAAMIASFPLAIWVMRNVAMAKTATNRTLAIHLPGAEKLLYLSDSLYSFILPFSAPLWTRLMVVGIVMFYLIIVIVILYKNKLLDNFNYCLIIPFVLIIYFLTYIILLLVSLSLFDASTPLDDRILVPAILVWPIIIISLSWYLSDSLNTKIIWNIFLSLLVFIILINGIRTVLRAVYIHNHGLGYNSTELKNSNLISYIKEYSDNKKIYTNDRLALQFLLEQEAILIPHKFFPSSLLANPSFEDDLNQMFKECRDGEAIIVYFNKVRRAQLPTIEEIESRSPVPVLRKFEDGVVLGR